MTCYTHALILVNDKDDGIPAISHGLRPLAYITFFMMKRFLLSASV